MTYLVSIYIGDIVSVDMRIIESKNLGANEATLTGESFPVEKSSGNISFQQPIVQELTNYLFAGTVVAQGSGARMDYASRRQWLLQ